MEILIINNSARLLFRKQANGGSSVLVNHYYLLEIQEQINFKTSGFYNISRLIRACLCLIDDQPRYYEFIAPTI